MWVLVEPLGGGRGVRVTGTKEAVAWAPQMRARVDDPRQAEAERITLVCDQLNTHTIGAFYEAFDPATAWSLIQRLEFRHTPKHGSWLNIAENELSAMTRQCVHGRRFATIEELREETNAWHQRTNDKQRGVDWQFRIGDARRKLKSLYPKIKA